MEEVVFRPNGTIANPTYADYRVPTSLDMPEIDAIVIESDEPNGPYGAKEVGEGGIMPVIPAILNAIYDATGVMVDELPASPERIVRGLRQALPHPGIDFRGPGRSGTQGPSRSR